jgi:AsmA-like C-terminal region/Protein of unknown function
VRRLPGQAAIGAAMLLHWLGTLAITLAVLTGVGVGAIAWRLSQGPVDLPWLASRLEEQANAKGGPTRLAIGSVALAWEGFRLGVDRPLDLRVTNLTVTDQSGNRRMAIPRAEVSLSLYELLFGRVAPRAVEVDGAQLTLLRAADGTLSLDLGSLTEATDSGEPTTTESGTAEPTPITGLLAELARPPTNDRGRSDKSLFSQLLVLRIHDARALLVDRQLGIALRSPQAEIDFRRRPEGGVDGTANLDLVLGEQHARLTASATLASGATATHLRVRLTPVQPSTLARAAPALHALSALDALVSVQADLDLDANLALHQAALTLTAGAGTLQIGQNAVPIVDATLVASGTPDAALLQTLRLHLRGHEAGSQSLVEVHGAIQRDADHLNAAASIDLDQLDFADLGRVWPEGVARDARMWIVENIPAGIARNGHVDISLAASQDLSSVALTQVSGTLDGDGLQVHWLRPIPPIDNGRAQLRIVNADTIDIIVASGRQVVRNQKSPSGGGLQIQAGRVRITGLTQRDQVSTINADITGSLADALALLHEPRLALLDRYPIELNNPAGQATVNLTVGLPLEYDLRMDDITVHAQSHLEGVHLGGVIAGRDLDQGVLDLDVTSDGLKLNGQARIAAVPVKLEAIMDFRAGPPAQVLQSVTVSGRPDAQQLAAAGLDATLVLSGPMQLQATLTERRNGQSEVAVSADLMPAAITVAALDWRKAPGLPAKSSARLLLDHDRLTAIDNIQLDGDSLALRGRAEFRDGKLALLGVDRLILGRTVAEGTVRLPTSSGSGPIVVNVRGATLDLSQRLSRPATARQASPRTEPPPGPPVTIEARFDRALLAHDQAVDQLSLNAEYDGRVFQRMRVDGRISSQSPIVVQIMPDKGGRQFTASASDAGQLLRGLDIVRTMQGGQLTVQARYDDTLPGRPLNGTADIEGFRIHNAPALGKLLQAMTLYGLVDVMQGPGLGFSRLIAPFRLTEDELDLADARAFSPSLGLTAKGRVDLAAQRIDMQGTIVPAYFFNSLLGEIPLVGKLFSPERGGGLFAASYSLRGALDDPEVTVNPLAAVTPGFLRGLFGNF